jgi:type VI secretion system secreted protein Hcp
VNVRLCLMAWTAAAALAAVPAATLAAVDAFIWFEGVAGNAKDAAHNGAFEIRDVSFGVENPTTIGSATSGAGAGKVKFNEFTIKRVTDSASPIFRRAMASGQHFAQVKLEMRKAGGDPGQVAVYTFNNVAVTKIDWSGPGDEGPEETITFVYGSMAISYTRQAPGQSTIRSPSNALPPAAQPSQHRW